MRHIAIAGDDEEPEGRYEPREGRSSTRRRNVPLMVTGIILTAGGGVGVVWLFSELISAWSSGAGGGHVKEDQEERIIGSLALGLGGLGLGLPLMIYGAKSVPAGSMAQQELQLVVGPGALSVRGTF